MGAVHSSGSDPGCRCAGGLGMEQRKEGTDKLLSGVVASDKRLKKDVCVSCHQAPRCRMMLILVIRNYISS